MPITYTDHLPPINDYYALFQTTGWSFRRPLTREVLAIALVKS